MEYGYGTELAGEETRKWRQPLRNPHKMHIISV